MLVGEQPGDREDIEGRPFVGPAGRVLDDALREAGIARDRIYVTNAVKHFKWVARGPRRIHATPDEREVVACSPWLRSEIELVAPAVLVCLGATAAKAMLGKAFRLTQHRGEMFDQLAGPALTATLHPSAILAGPAERRREMLAGLVRRPTRRRRGRLRGLSDPPRGTARRRPERSPTSSRTRLPPPAGITCTTSASGARSTAPGRRPRPPPAGRAP